MRRNDLKFMTTNIELDAARAAIRVPKELERIGTNLSNLAEAVGERKAHHIDWEQRRYELAKAAITGACLRDYDFKIVARDAVAYADELIDELKSKKL